VWFEGEDSPLPAHAARQVAGHVANVRAHIHHELSRVREPIERLADREIEQASTQDPQADLLLAQKA
jgi:hypothetical protein